MNSPISLMNFSSARVWSLLVVCLLPVLALGQSSKAHIIVDTRTGKILDGRNYTDKLPVASLTKVVTASVVLDWTTARNSDINALMIVPAEAFLENGANPLGLRAGDRISIRDGLSSALMASDNVAAYTLAKHIGTEMWQMDGGKARSGVEFFVTQMNLLAEARGMTRSRFVNPDGSDAGRNKGYSTAADMVRITAYAIKKPSFNFIASQKQRDVSFQRGAEKLAFRIYNTNTLLEQFGVDGVNTGRTNSAGDCLITSVRKPDRIEQLPGNRQIRT
ncbi:MAG: serine hydrolase, partial [Verrucomicrobiota bacterium]